MKEFAICIPSKRKPPFKTLENFQVPEGFEVFIISDPAFLAEHHEYYGKEKGIHVLKGGEGIGQQMWNTYLVAADAGFDHFVRLDDDLDVNTFVAVKAGSNRKVKYLSLEEAMYHLLTALRMTETTLVGFSNTSRLDWLGNGYKRTYGLIHSGACLSVSSNTPQLFMDRTLTKWGDV